MSALIHFQHTPLQTHSYSKKNMPHNPATITNAQFPMSEEYSTEQTKTIDYRYDRTNQKKTQPTHFLHYISFTYFVLSLYSFWISKMNEFTQIKILCMKTPKLLVVSNLVSWNHSKSSNWNNLTFILYSIYRISQSIFLQIVFRFNLYNILLIRFCILSFHRLLFLSFCLTVYQYRLRITGKRKSIELICIRPIKFIQSR